MKQFLRLLWSATFFLFAFSLVACTGPKATIHVGSKDFTEQFVVAEMYAHLLEDAGFEVVRNLNIGSTPVIHEKMVSGEISIYPEYTGTSFLTVLKQDVKTDPVVVYNEVAAMYAAQFNLTVLEPAPMNNTQAIAMTKERAAELGITSISDLVTNASEVVLIGPIEFIDREDGLAGLKGLYGEFEFAEYRPIDPGLRYITLANGGVDAVVAFGTDGQISKGGVDAVVAFGTDGQISEFDLLVLEDDRQFWPPYQIAPVIQSDLIEAHPEIETILNQLAPLLTDDTMRRLNNEVSTNGRSPADVAREFLIDSGLISE